MTRRLKRKALAVFIVCNICTIPFLGYCHNLCNITLSTISNRRKNGSCVLLLSDQVNQMSGRLNTKAKVLYERLKCRFVWRGVENVNKNKHMPPLKPGVINSRLQSGCRPRNIDWNSYLKICSKADQYRKKTADVQWLWIFEFWIIMASIADPSDCRLNTHGFISWRQLIGPVTNYRARDRLVSLLPSPILLFFCLLVFSSFFFFRIDLGQTPLVRPSCLPTLQMSKKFRLSPSVLCFWPFIPSTMS